MKKMWKMMVVAGVILLLTACGTSSESEDMTTGSGDENKGVLAGAVVPNLIKNDAKGKHHYVFQLKNETEKDVTLTMNSAQFFDYHLTDESGKVLYKDSENKMYTQMLQESMLKPGDTLEMEVDATEGLSSLPKGTYTLEVWSTADEAEDWKASEEITWEDATTTTTSSDGKLKVEEEVVTYNGRQDLNSIEVVNEQNEVEAMRLAEVARPFFDDLESKVKIKVFYVIIDGQKVIQNAELA
ncbi:MAG: BsuPI-related putative proteinase inhibitor [Paenisporosarcina sp.]